MGCDLYAIETPSNYDPSAAAGPDPFYFQFGWEEMSLMVETLAEVDAIDFDTPHPEFPEFPATPQNWPAAKWWDYKSAACRAPGRFFLASRGHPLRFNPADDRTSARPLDDQLAWPVPHTQRRWSTQRQRDDHRAPGARCAPDRRGELEDGPRRTANSVRRDRGLQRCPGARSRMGSPARRGTRT